MKTINKILIPVDFSPASINAFKYGVGVAKKFDSEVVVIHSVKYPVSFPESQTLVQPLGYEEMESSAEIKLEEMVREFPECQEINLRKFHVSGFAVDGIAETVLVENPDLLIMGTKGASGLNEFFLGSTTSHVIHKVSTSVMVIPEEARFESLENILFLFDFEGQKDSPLLSPLKLIAKEFSSFLHILYVKGKYPTKHFDDLAFLDNYFNTVKHGISSSLFEHFRGGVNDFVKKNQIGLIAILIRERNFFEKLFHISRTDQLAFHSKVPILAIHE